MKTIRKIVIILMLLFGVLFGEIPRQIHYQGRLTDNNDNLLTGNYNMVFRIYNVESGGSALWEETHNNVSVSDGVFNVSLGSKTTLTLNFDEQYW